MAGRVVAEIVRAASFVRLLTDQVDRFVFNNRLARHHISVSRALFFGFYFVREEEEKNNNKINKSVKNGAIIFDELFKIAFAIESNFFF